MASTVQNGALAPMRAIGLTEDEIDDILFIARTDALDELGPYLDSLATKYDTSKAIVLTSAVDPETGNTALHYAGANGHAYLLQALLSHLPSPTTASDPASSSFPFLNHQNESGNTALHWAALNGHLPAVRLLVKHGADASVLNGAGHDAVFEAEMGEKSEVVEFLLQEARGLDTGLVEGGGGNVGEHVGEEADGEGGGAAESNGKEVEGLRNGVERMGMNEK